MFCRLVFLATLFAGPGLSQAPFVELFYGGSGHDVIRATAVDAAGNIYVGGTTASVDLPLLNAFQTLNSGTQLIISSDAGATWKPLSSPFPDATPSQPVAIAIDPTSPSTLYLGSAQQVCKSLDAGKTLSCVAISTPPSGVITSLAIDPQTPTTIYASTTHVQGVFKSTDGGKTWSNMSAGLPLNLYVDSVAIDPFHSNGLYAWVGSGGYVSQNGGVSWTASNSPWPLNSSVTGGIHYSFDPVTAGVIYAPGLGSKGLAIVKSSDAGKTWSQLSTPFNACCVLPDPQVSGVLYILTGVIPGGVPATFWKSTDGGASWNSFSIPSGASGPLAIDPANPKILIAGAYRTADGGKTWTPTNASRAIQPAFAPSSPSIVFATAPISTDAFIAKFLPDGKTLAFATYYGGMGNETGNSIALDTSGNIWITGSTSSVDLPLTQGSYQPALRGALNGYVAKFSNDGKLLASTYLGGDESGCFVRDRNRSSRQCMDDRWSGFD